MKTFRSLARKTATKVQKRKETMKRIALAVGHACLDESRNKFMMDKENSFIAASQRPEMESSRRTVDRKNNGSLRSRRRSEQIALGDLQASNRSPVPLSQFKKDGNKQKKKEMVEEKSTKNMERQQEMDRVTALALHQADVYFDRLSLENPGQSPFVARGAPDNRITSILQSSSKTPKSSSRRLASESPVDTPVSDLFSANDSVPEMRDNAYAKNANDSPVSSLMLFYTKSGPLDSTPKSYCSDGDDTQRNEDSRQSRNIAKSSRNIAKPSMKLNRSESQDSGSSLYTNESKSYKKANGKNLKLLSHHGHQNALPIVRAEKVKTIPRKTNKPNVSKLESLFRPPIMSALSTDDAQSAYSYDPYEIKVTESAPGAIQAVALGFRKTSPRNADDESQSASRLSMDSQRERSSIGKSMVSNQACNNADFLFTGDYGPIVRTKKPAHDDATLVSISTAGSRSRLAPKVKGVSIPTKNSEKENDDISFDSRSTRSERRVRFSEGSFRTRLLKQRDEVLDTKEHPFDEAEEIEERDDSTIRSTKSFESNDEEIEEDEALYNKFVKKPNMSYHQFGSNVTRNVARVNSVDESIDLPEIESKGSDLSESTSNASRKSLESARSVRSNHSINDTIPEEEDVPEEEDMMTVMSRDSVHWTKTQTGVTPFVRGKANAVPTKSPYFRYKDAMNQFKPKTKLKTEGRVVPKKARSPQKAKSPKKSPSKSPKHIMRKGSGGLVSLRIQELNTRVSEERKLKRMRKKTTNPRLHTHNFDNTQLPVRSQGLNTYKTNIGSANIQKSNNMMAAKFNMIPTDVYEDDDDSTILPANTSQLILSPAKENDEDDDVLSKMSEMTGTTLATVRQVPRGLMVHQSRESIATVRQERNSVATVRQLPRGLTLPQQRDSVATVRQERNVVATVLQQRDSYEGSTTSRSTTSSGLSRLKKQVFRNSDAASISENTTLSAMIQKENDENTMLAPPLMGTPAMKWRTLAAKAAEKDALKTSSTKPNRKMKGLGNRNMNVQQSYETEKDTLKTNSTKPSRKMNNGLGARNMNNVQHSYEIYGFKD